MDFGVWFTNFLFIPFLCVFLVTGSDKDKTIEQVGDEIYSFVKKVYNCSGSDVYMVMKMCLEMNGNCLLNAREWLEQELADSDFF